MYSVVSLGVGVNAVVVLYHWAVSLGVGVSVVVVLYAVVSLGVGVNDPSVVTLYIVVRLKDNVLLSVGGICVAVLFCTVALLPEVDALV